MWELGLMRPSHYINILNSSPPEIINLHIQLPPLNNHSISSLPAITDAIHATLSKVKSRGKNLGIAFQTTIIHNSSSSPENSKPTTSRLNKKNHSQNLMG